MKCSRPVGLVLVTLVTMTYSMPPETTSRSSPFRENQKITKNDILDVNTTSLNILDVRTPPKIRQQLQNKLKQKEEIENSHAGVAIPVDETAVKLEETTKKMNFYKIERPTTDSGLSTWILVSGNTSPPPTKPPSKNAVAGYNNGYKPKENSTTILRKPEKIVKPIFRKRTPITTEKTSRPPPTTTTSMHELPKLTKVKASELNKAVNKKNNTAGVMKKPTTVSNSTKKSTSTPNHPKISSTTEGVKNIVNSIANSDLKNSTDLSSSSLSAEPKEGDADLSNSDGKKKKNPSKRKKNKNRRRKPVEKNGNNTSVSKPAKVKKEKPISTQLYNYLSREIMPTVGVGLVGLMVTAGLASYFLYPFGIARRSYEIDRKDKEGNYFYSNDYSNGIPEEEAIGKVIAGMPSNSESMATNSYSNTRYRLVDRRAQIKPQPYEGVVQGSVEDVPLTFDRQDQDNTYSSNYQTLDYSTNLDDKKFVVGNVPEELVKEVTPVSVPEHGPRNLNVLSAVESVNKEEKVQERVNELRPAFGPRSLRIRRKRSGISNEIEDLTPIEPIDVTESEFIQKIEKEVSTTTEGVTTESLITTTEVPSTTTEGFPQKFASFLDLMQDLIHVKARLSLQILQNASHSFSRYISRAQARLDEHIRKRAKKD
nr:uncharacterized protein LOC111512606 [Leptinotarsa decemlineata]XP_023024516.1 uncharacterized protein LOC111512606 [Leptinotarsa decemlineata]